MSEAFNSLLFSLGGAGVLPHGLYVCAAVKGMVFRQFTLGLEYVNQSVWV